jgi:hypothetical protein
MDYYQKYLKYKHKYNSTKHKPKQILTGGDIIELGFFSLSKQIIMPNSKNYTYYINLNFNNNGVELHALRNNPYYKSQDDLGWPDKEAVSRIIKNEISSTDTYYYNESINAWTKKI